MKKFYWRGFLCLLILAPAVLLTSCNKKISLVRIDDALMAEEHIKLGMIYFQDKEFPEAKKQFLLALDQDKKNSDAWFGLGLCDNIQGDYKDAVKDFKTALELKPGFAEAHNNLADAYLKLGDIESAEKEVKEAIRLGGDNLCWYRLTYAEVLFARKEIEYGCAELALAKKNPGKDKNLDSLIRPLWEQNCHDR
jgi:tetratricopeptide (TPR) repeat protein